MGPCTRPGTLSATRSWPSRRWSWPWPRTASPCLSWGRSLSSSSWASPTIPTSSGGSSHGQRHVYWANCSAVSSVGSFCKFLWRSISFVHVERAQACPGQSLEQWMKFWDKNSRNLQLKIPFLKRTKGPVCCLGLCRHRLTLFYHSGLSMQ